MKILRPFRQVSPRYSATREQLREIARAHNIPRGRNTADTVKNLREAGLLPNITKNPTAP